MDLLIVVLVLLILCGGGGFYYTSRPTYTGPAIGGWLGLLIAVLLIVFVLRVVGAV